MHELQVRFKFKKDEITAPEDYLGAKVQRQEMDGIWMWTLSSVDFVKEVVDNVIATLKDQAIHQRLWY